MAPASSPVTRLAGEPTAWTIGVVVTETYGNDQTWRLTISESIFGGDSFDLRSGERSPAVIRPDDGDYLVQVVGASAFTKSWSCVGDDSTTPQTSSANFFQVFTTPNDTRMDCTLTLTNPTPSTLVIEHVYPDEPSATATYNVVYGTRTAPRTDSPGAGGTLADGQSTALTTWSGQPLFITGASVPGGWLTDVQCSNSTDTDFFVDWNAFRADATVSGFRMRAGDTTTCRFLYEPLGTVTIVEDSEPGAPAADYTASPADRIVSGPTAFSLSDGQTQKLTLTRNQNVSVTRSGVPEYDFESLECVRLLDGGGTTPEPFSSSFSRTGDAFVNVRVDAGVDVVCTFSSVLAGPPTVTLSQRLLVVDPSAFADLSVEIRDATTNGLLDTVDFGSISDPDGIEITLPDRGEYRLSVVDDQGLDISWNCGDQTGNSTTIDVVLGDSIGCRVTADESPPGGTGSLTLEKVSSPNPAARYPIDVLFGAYPILGVFDGEGTPSTVAEGAPLLVEDLAAGVYAIIETTPPDTQLTGVDCGSAAVSAITREPLEIDGVVFWLNRFTVTLVDADDVTCALTNELAGPSTPSDRVTLDVDVSTGPVDLSSDYSFATEVAGPGLRGPAGTGTTQTVDLADGDSELFRIDEATEITISPIDSLAGASGFEYRIECGTLSEVNAPLTFTPAGDIDCTISFEARTITVEKVVEPFGTFDTFDVRVDSTVDGVDTLSVGDGDRRTVVAPLAESVEVTELDPGLYDASIECTEVELAGPVTPSTGPFGGASVTVPADRASYECAIVNSAPPPTEYAVVLESVLDLGAVAIPENFPGIDVEFDGDIVVREDVERVASRFSVARLVQAVTVPPNGSTSVLVSAGGVITIAAGASAEAFATSISCPGGTTNLDGSVTVSAVTSDITCVMTNTAANLTLRNSVIGTTSVTAWPFSITNVIAGPSTPSLGRTGSVTVAVAVAVAVGVTQTNTLGATTVDSSCGPVVPPPATSGFDTTQSVNLGGGASITCTFVSTYATPAPPPSPPPPPTTPTVPASGAAAGATTPATTVPATTVPATTVPGSTVPATTVPGSTATDGSTPGTPTPVAAPTVTVLATSETPDGNASTGDLPSTTTTSTTTTTTTPTESTDEPAPDDGQSTVPDDPPAATITDDGPQDLFVDIGEPIPVEIDCAGEIVVLVDGVAQARVDQIEPSSLGLGDHLIEVRCDGETVTEVRAVVFEQEEGAPAGSNMTVIVMFVVMAAGAFLFVPSAASRKRLPI